MKKTIIIILTFFITFFANSQNKVHTINEFNRAYKNGTRSYNGKPGENYFVNYCDYTIEANFNPETGFLTGSETIIYHNESPDTLDMMVIRLYQNLFQKGSPRDFGVNPEDLTEGVQIKKIIFDRTEIDLTKTQTYATNLYLRTPTAITPKSTVKLEIEWEFNYPKNTTVRNGYYKDRAWFIGYWYPQIATYDDIFGWDRNHYSGATEFYNEPSNFDVKITVDAPNLIWATGELQNIDEIFTKKYQKRIEGVQQSDDVVKIITPEDYKSGKILKKSDKNTFHFIAKKVPDFSFATSDSHNWDAVGLKIQDQEKKVLISGVFKEESENFHQLAKFSKDIINIFSTKIPAIPYPYPTMTVFEGDGGMEYPMMVNEACPEDICDAYYVTAHEIGHSYFPFYTGLNETRYAWMDEGLISYFPRLVVDILLPDCNAEAQILNNYTKDANGFHDLPLMTPTNIFKDFWAYRVIAYDRSSYALQQLNLYMGDSLFFAALQEFTDRWKYKHPYPWDFFNTFEDVANEDLTWFWKPYFFEFSEPNLAITDVEFMEQRLYVTIENVGGMPLPVYLEINMPNGRSQKVEKNSGCWKEGNYFELKLDLNQKPKSIKIGNEFVLDIDENDNFFGF